MAFRVTCGFLLVVFASFLSNHVFSQTSKADPNHEKKMQVSKKVELILKDLEKVFKDVKTVATDFIQEKRLAVFKQTLVLKGKIFLENPGRLAWRVSTPLKYSLVISGDMLTQWDEDTNTIQKISLSSNPIFKVVSEQLQSWFRGEYLSLAKEYEIRLKNEKPVVVLAFIPRKESVTKKTIKKVVVTFRKDRRYVREILIEDKTGDSTKMTFIETVLNKPIKEEMWEVKARG